MSTTPLFLPLASAIALPQSPAPITASQDLLLDTQEESKSSSRLSINERVTNMHYGYAANHAPPVYPLTKGLRSQVSLATRTSTLKRGSVVRTSLSNLVKSSKTTSQAGLLKNATIHKSGSLPRLATQVAGK